MATWLKSNRSNSPLVAHISNDVYYREHHEIVGKLLERVGVIVAEVEIDGDELAGYICAERSGEDFVVHYVYVKPLYRKVGLAKCLLLAAGWSRGEDIIATHITYVQTDGKLTRYRIENNPYLLSGAACQ